MAAITEEVRQTLGLLRQNVDNMLDRFRHTEHERSRSIQPQFRGPEMDIEETDTSVVVKAELPGLEAKDIKVHATSRSFTIAGEKKVDRESHDGALYRRERRYGAFTRTFSLPAEIDPDHVQAEFKNGVLTVTLPKTQESKAKHSKVEVKSR